MALTHEFDLRSSLNNSLLLAWFETFLIFIVSVLGREEGYTVKYNPLPEGVPEGEAQGNS